MSILDQMRVLLREHKEEAEARKAAIKPDPPHVTVPASLVRATNLASWMAYFALVYFLLLYTFDIARDRSASLHVTHFGTWVGDIQIYAPYIIGFLVVAVGIPYVAKIAIPTFTRLSWREAATEKAWALFIAVAVSFVVIAGTFTVQGDTILERDRESVVAVEQTQQAASVLQAQITSKEAELRSMMENRNAYLAQAASVGAVEWQRSYIDQTSRSDPQRDRIVRALGAARSADNVRAELATLRERAATQTTTAAVASRVTTASNGWIASTLGWLEGARAMLLSFVMDIVCLIMPLIALRLELKRNQQLGMGDSSGWADDAHRIEDHTADDPLPVQPMKGPREVVRDAETGEELIKITPKAHWRKKKGKPQRIEADVMAMADETGVPDGGARAGSVAPGFVAPVADEPSSEAADTYADEQQHEEAVPEIDQNILQLTDEDYANLPSAENEITETTDSAVEDHSEEQTESETASEYVPAFPALTYERAVAADDEEPDAHVRARNEYADAK